MYITTVRAFGVIAHLIFLNNYQVLSRYRMFVIYREYLGHTAGDAW